MTPPDPFEKTRKPAEPQASDAEPQAYNAEGATSNSLVAHRLTDEADVREAAMQKDLKRILTADKDAWMDYLEHPVYSRLLHHDLEIGRGLIGDPRFRRWRADPSYRPRETRKAAPEPKRMHTEHPLEQIPAGASPGHAARQDIDVATPTPDHRDWAKEWSRMSGKQRARSAYEEHVPRPQRQELPPIPVYYTTEMAELDRLPSVMEHVPGAAIGWRLAELGWGETAGTGLSINREEVAEELAWIITEEMVKSWAAGRVVKGIATLDALRSTALNPDALLKRAMRPTAVLGGEGPALLPRRVSPRPSGAGATAMKSLRLTPPLWKAPPPSWKPSGGGGGMQLQPQLVPRPGGGVGVGMRSTPVITTTLGPPQSGTTGKGPPTSDVATSGFQDYAGRLAKAPAKAATPMSTPAPGVAVEPGGWRAPLIWLPGSSREHVQAPPAERREPIAEPEAPPAIKDPMPEHSDEPIGDRQGELERGPFEVAGKPSGTSKVKYRDPPRATDPARPGQLPFPQRAEQQAVDRYALALARLRQALERRAAASNPREHQAAASVLRDAQRQLDRLDHEALERGGNVIGHIDALSRERITLEQRGLGATEAGGVTTSLVATIGGRLRGLSYTEVRARLGTPSRVFPPDRGASGRGRQAGRGSIEWVIRDPMTNEIAGSIRLDLPTPQMTQPGEAPRPQSAENPHLARLLPGGQLHVDEQGVIVPADSTSAHLEIQADQALLDELAHTRGTD